MEIFPIEKSSRGNKASIPLFETSPHREIVEPESQVNAADATVPERSSFSALSQR